MKNCKGVNNKLDIKSFIRTYFKRGVTFLEKVKMKGIKMKGVEMKEVKMKEVKMKEAKMKKTKIKRVKKLCATTPVEMNIFAIKTTKSKNFHWKVYKIIAFEIVIFFNILLRIKLN